MAFSLLFSISKTDTDLLNHGEFKASPNELNVNLHESLFTAKMSLKGKAEDKFVSFEGGNIEAEIEKTIPIRLGDSTPIQVTTFNLDILEGLDVAVELNGSIPKLEDEANINLQGGLIDIVGNGRVNITGDDGVVLLHDAQQLQLSYKDQPLQPPPINGPIEIVFKDSGYQFQIPQTEGQSSDVKKVTLDDASVTNLTLNRSKARVSGSGSLKLFGSGSVEILNPSEVEFPGDVTDEQKATLKASKSPLLLQVENSKIIDIQDTFKSLKDVRKEELILKNDFGEDFFRRTFTGDRVI